MRSGGGLVNDLLNDALNSITERIDALIGENDRIDSGLSAESSVSSLERQPEPYRLKFQIIKLNDFSTEIDPAIRDRFARSGDTDPKDMKTDRSGK